jgi:phosphate transport system substrate-binding protein
MIRQWHRKLVRIVSAPALGLTLCVGMSVGAARAADIVLNETGSTLLYPLFEQWVSAYGSVRPDVKLTIAATGSGEGIKSALGGTVRIGASDAYMSDEDAEHNPQIINVPLAISAQTIYANVPDQGDTVLQIDGPTLAGIYSGRITQWDDPGLVADNPGVKLPHHVIVPVRRADASGDTFVFTQFLDFSVQSWEDRIGYGTSVSWPAVSGMQTATGNDGMVKTIGASPYSIGYVGISFSGPAAKAGIRPMALKNQNGKFLVPTTQSISAAASTLDPRTPPDERLSLVDAPGDGSYPLVNYEYAVVSTAQPDSGTADALKNFLLWSIAVDGGNAARHLDAVGFIPLPDFIRALSEKQIGRIGGRSS